MFSISFTLIRLALVIFANGDKENSQKRRENEDTNFKVKCVFNVLKCSTYRSPQRSAMCFHSA